jgi:hypothetical protein
LLLLGWYLVACLAEYRTRGAGLLARCLLVRNSYGSLSRGYEKLQYSTYPVANIRCLWSFNKKEGKRKKKGKGKEREKKRREKRKEKEKGKRGKEIVEKILSVSP